jgi:hypothetical protein
MRPVPAWLPAVDRSVADTSSIPADGIRRTVLWLHANRRKQPTDDSVTDPFYATDPDQSPPPSGSDLQPARRGFGNLPFAQPAAPAAAAQSAAHYPWSLDAQQANGQARRGGFLRLLLNGLRAILLLPVRPGAVDPGAGSCLALVVLITAMGIAGEWWLLAEPTYLFNWGALRSAWFDLPLIVLGGAWLAQPPGPGLFGRRRLPTSAAAATPLLHFAAVVLSASAWIVAIAYGLLIAISHELIPGDIVPVLGSWIYLAAPLWSYLVAVRTVSTMNRSTPIPILRRFAVLLLLAATTAWSIVDPLESYWEAPEGLAPTGYAGSEEILELQGELLGAQLAKILPGRAAVADLYFIGFAPYASEDVFRKELEVIHPLMDKRFDTAGRSLRLVNNAGTLREYPIATVSNLRRALAAFAARMDPKNDVLVLYVTTHGSRNAVLAVDLPPLTLYNIDPATLKGLLDEAGIRNRVLIISACYSGTFIEPLRGPDTLIMTASTADRPSFGCGSESDFTYFGDAIFNQALRQTVSFEDAFAQALPKILQREQAEGFEPSQPQIAVGDAIRGVLARVEKRLASPSR